MTTAASSIRRGCSMTTRASPAKPATSIPGAPGASTPSENATVSKQYNQALVSALFHATGCKDWTTDDNARLHPLVAAGDKTARETMIAGNMPLVVSKVETFIR